MHHSVSTISEQITEMNRVVFTRFIVSEVLGPIFQLIIVVPLALRIAEGRRAKE